MAYGLHLLRSVGNWTEQRFVEQPYGVADGRNGMSELLNRCAQPPTAVICGNDVLAIGAIFECQSRDLEVPAAISITGFDDLSISAHLQPGLTTVKVPSSEMGAKAADFLVKRINGETTLLHTEIETTLIVRGTTKSAANRVVTDLTRLVRALAGASQ